jgi:hypothetical protein
MQRAERYRTELLKRGVLLIPVIFGASQKVQIKPKGFGTTRSAASAPSVGVSLTYLLIQKLSLAS